MSLKKLKRAFKRVVRPALQVGAMAGIPGFSQANAVANAFAANRQNVSPRQVAAQGFQGPTTALGLVSSGFRQPSAVGTNTMSLAPMIFQGGRLAGSLGRSIGNAVRRVPRPGAGTVLGGAAVVGSMVPAFRGAQRVNPRTGMPIRRSKGITSTQLKAFVRVTGILNKYCKIAPPTAKRGAPRRGKACR